MKLWDFETKTYNNVSPSKEYRSGILTIIDTVRGRGTFLKKRMPSGSNKAFWSEFIG